MAWNSRNGLTELLALLAVLESGFVGALRHAKAERGDGDAAAVENAHGVDESVAFLAEEIFGRDLAIFKDEFGGVAGAKAELVFLLAGTEALGSLLDDERPRVRECGRSCR